jgi:ferritin-like metal-binding protein YciE
MKMQTLHDLFVHELKDVYDAEHQLVEVGIPNLKSKASASKLKEALDMHLDETMGHIQRLEEIFDKLGEKAERKACHGIKGLIKEADDMLKHDMSKDVMDAAIITMAQKCEHYEIASYGCLATYAELMGHTEVTQLLRENLSEEERADAALTQCARDVNQAAMA